MITPFQQPVFGDVIVSDGSIFPTGMIDIKVTRSGTFYYLTGTTSDSNRFLYTYSGYMTGATGIAMVDLGAGVGSVKLTRM